MVRDEHAPFIDNIPAYALGALDAEDVAALESHLRTCASCRTELAEYRKVSASLLTAIPPQNPPAALRRRLQNQLPSARKPARPQWTWSFGQIATAFAVVALLVLNLASFTQVRQMQSRQAQLLEKIENSEVALAMLSSPGVEQIPINGDVVSGTLLLDRDNNKAVLIVESLPQLDEGQTYQAWLVQPDGGRISAGLFKPEDGQFPMTKTISSENPFSNYQGIGVTVEPAGGSDAPTGERIFHVDF